MLSGRAGIYVCVSLRTLTAMDHHIITPLFFLNKNGVVVVHVDKGQSDIHAMQMHVVQEFSFIQQRSNGNKQIETHLKEVHVCEGLDHDWLSLSIENDIDIEVGCIMGVGGGGSIVFRLRIYSTQWYIMHSDHL